MYSATHSDATGGSVISLPFYPSEDPSRREHDDWLGSSRSILVRGNYSAAMSGSIPHWLLSLRQQSAVDDVPALTAQQQEASSPIDVIKHARLVDDAALKKATSKLAFEAGLREYHNKLAAILDAAMRKNGGLRLRNLLQKHKDPEHDGCFDGGAMWRELESSGVTLDARFDDARVHDRAFESARDVFLPDGCSANLGLHG